MSREFAAGSSERLEDTSWSGPTSVPCTILVSAYPTSGTGTQCLVSIGDISSTDWFAIFLRGDETGDPFEASNNGTSANFARGGSANLNAWNQIGAVFAGEGDHRIWQDGIEEDTGSGNSGADSGRDTLYVGALARSGTQLYFNGRLAEVAIYDVALTDAEMQAHGDGVSPLLIRPQNLQRYYPIIGEQSPEPDRISGNSLTVVATPLKSPHPGLIYPIGQSIYLKPVAASPATISAVSSATNGANTATSLGALTITVDDSTGITGVTVGGIACTSIVLTNGTTVDCVAPKAFGDDYGTSRNVIVNNGSDSNSFAVTTHIPAGTLETDFTVAYASLNVDSPFAGDPTYSAIVSGDSCVYDSVTSPDSHAVSMSGDGVFTLTGTPTQNQTFDVFIFDTSDNTAGSDATITIEAATGPKAGTLSLMGVGI